MKQVRRKSFFLRFSLSLLILLAVFFVVSEIYAQEDSGIIINEIQISGGKGKTTQDYIELYNKSDKAKNIGGWQLKKRNNSTKTENGIKIETFSESSLKVFDVDAVIPASGYFLWASKDIALDELADQTSGGTISSNNSIALFDSNKKIIDQVAWGSGHRNPFVEGDAFNAVFEKDAAEIIERKDFQDSQDNSEDFRIISKGSPTASGCDLPENASKCVALEEERQDSSIMLKLSKKVYVNAYAYFSIAGLEKNAKVTWTFGDGHKSYLQSTKHKYLAIGKYDASVKYVKDGKAVVKNFTVEVENMPHPDVEIVAINPNPKGKDTENETISIKNNSKKKVNLNGWSIATGWKKLINHPIKEDFVILKGKTKKLTRDFSKFTLNNKKAEIELRYPDGEVADDVKYKKAGSIEEEEIYQKIKKKWKWIGGSERKPASSKQEIELIKRPEVQQASIQNKSLDSIPAASFKPNKKIKFLNSEIKLGKFDIELYEIKNVSFDKSDNAYHFNRIYPDEKHYAIVFIQGIFLKTNAKLNNVINLLF